jgi:hypothetical protein
MKNTLISFFILLFTFQMVQCQVIDSNTSQEKSYDYYSVKQLQNKRAARICLGTGGGLIIVGGLVAVAGVANAESSATPIGVGMFLLGSATTIASIPLFIATGSNKRKAKLSLKAEPLTFGIKSTGNSNYTALAFSIPF